MVRREADRRRMLHDVVQPDRLRLVDQVPEHAPALRQRADQLPGVGVDALGDELDELMMVAAHPNAP